MSSPVRRVAVTGASGYLGDGLMRHLEAEDEIERILAIDIRQPRRPHAPKVVFQHHDVARPMPDLFSAHGIDSVVHLAYILNPGHDRAANRRVNVGGAANVLEACEAAGVRHVLYLSSTSVYGAHPDNPRLLTEESPVRPVEGFQYSEDKAESEALITEFVRQHPDCAAAILRVCPVMGPNADNFIARAFSKPFLVAARGYDPPMQFIHEDDLADVVRLCLLRQVSGLYNVGGDGYILWSEMVRVFGRRMIRLPARLLYRLIGLAWNLRLQRDSPPCGLDMVRHPWIASAEKIKRELGISFRYSSMDAWDAFAGQQRRRRKRKEAQG